MDWSLSECDNNKIKMWNIKKIVDGFYFCIYLFVLNNVNYEDFLVIK